MSDLYQEHILDHYANPRNQGHLNAPDIAADSDDPSCGDKIHLEIGFDANGKVARVAFNGEGCMVAMASTSIFTESIKGKSLADLKAITDDQVLAMLGAEVGPNRRRCALSPIIALREGLEAYQGDE
jgi:nitrogen fixation NifU-like protein